MIIDEKVLMYPPPPPYLPSSIHLTGPGLSQFPSNNLSGSEKTTFASLPPHILLEIIYNTFPRDSIPSSVAGHNGGGPSSPLSPGGGGRYTHDHRLYEDSKPERQRKTLYWLSTSLRLVNRQLYTACMHILRSTYLPSYQALIRPPYSSDPFPLGVPTSNSPGGDASLSHPPAYASSTTIQVSSAATTSPLHTLQRETPLLDRFIALKVRQDVFADESELHIDREDAYRDIFDVGQPRARLEDLVRVYGVKDGVVSVPGQSGRTSGYAGSIGSKNSSLISLQTPISPSSPTTSTNQLPAAKPHQKTKRSIFSSFRKPPSSTTPPSSYPPQAPPEITPVPFSLLSISFSPRKVGLMYNRSRTIVELPRATTAAARRTETLEALASEIVDELKRYLEGR